MENQQPEALRLAGKLKDAIQLLDLGFDEDIDPDELDKAALELEALHARNQELEAMLDAVGAGGVSAQRVTQADARDAELVAAVVYASTEAMNSSMESPSFDGTIILESHHAASLSLALDELERHRAAIAAAKGKSK